MLDSIEITRRRSVRSGGIEFFISCDGVVLAAVRGDKTLAELAQQFDIHPNQITQWKAQLLDGAAGVFGTESRGDSQGPAVDLTVLHAKIGELTLENDFLAGALGKAGLPSAKR